MTLSTFLRTGFLAATALLPTLWASDIGNRSEALVVHEWGTFTSVANERGEPVEWAPLSGPADLPCFVERRPYATELSPKLMPGLVRMETPVLYFYPQHPMTLSIHVDFPHGWITEWYPRATDVEPQKNNVPPGVGYRDGMIRWDSVEASPGENPALPLSEGPSHYYAARNTDAAALLSGDQRERFLFYRGIGSFQQPVRPKFTQDGKLEIANAAAEAIPLMMVFENREGRVGYRIRQSVKGTITVEPPSLGARLDELKADLADRLIEAGLYPKEAAAMIETWKDSWFEEGTRVIFVYPRSVVDTVLPLRVTPAPTTVARTFVGRVEVLSPWIEETISTAVNNNSTAGLAKFGRFLDAFLLQIERTQGRKLFLNADLQRTRTLISRQANARSCVE